MAGPSHPLADIRSCCDDLVGVIRLLLADVIAENNAGAVHPTAARLIGLAIDRPEILLFVLHEVCAHLILLADLVLQPATTALAADLGSALSVLSSERRAKLLGAILETDEPLILTQILSFGPPVIRGSVEERIRALAPAQAGAIHTWPEMQARIDELLTAGTAEAAERYIVVEETKTVGQVPRRESARFRNRLRLYYLRGDWSAIESATTLVCQMPFDQRLAEETLSFFQGLAAMARFRILNPIDQARVFDPRPEAFEALVIDYVRAAADSLTSLVPMMKGMRTDSVEDDLTAFIQHLLGARIHFLGWSVGDQSRGGFTAKGNPGERALTLKWGNTILALIEAVIWAQPLSHDAVRADLKSHFQKLLGYGNPCLFFHVTYAYGEDTASLMRFLETVAQSAQPPGFSFKGRDEIRQTDTRPPGFVARYDTNSGEVKVIFLVLHLGQQRQREAAKVAEATKKRRAPKQKKAKNAGDSKQAS